MTHKTRASSYNSTDSTMIKVAAFLAVLVSLWLFQAEVLTARSGMVLSTPLRGQTETSKAPLSFEELTKDDATFFGGEIDWDAVYKVDHSSKYVPYDFLREYPMSSPYTLRWEPEEQLEDWAANVQVATRRNVPYGKDVCFVHVGKAAGSSLGTLLGFQLHNKDINCERPDGLLSKYTTHVMHNTVNDCADDSPYYLWNLRSPLQRLKSAYPYDRDKPRKKTIYSCYNTLNELGEALDLDSAKSGGEYCQAKAFQNIAGLDRLSGHTFANLRFYYYEAFRNAKNLDKSKILVIRVEHFGKDYMTAENVLSNGESTDINLKVPVANKGTSKQSDDDYLSPLALQKLCEAICPEIQMYKYLLQTAENLSRSDYLTSLEELSRDCPVEAKANTCPYFDHREIYRKDSEKGWVSAKRSNHGP